MDENFTSSLLANGLLALGYAIWKVFDRCSKSKCRMDKESGLVFDLGEPADCPATDMSNLADLLKQRSMHHLRAKNKSPSPEQI